MKWPVVRRVLLGAVLTLSVSSYGGEAKRIYFEKVEDKSIFAVLEPENDGIQVLNVVAGVRLKPQSQTYIELIEEGYLSAFLSPDKARLLVSLGHVDEKNIWVVNVKTSALEFASHENLGRHLFPKWLNSSSFDLMYGGMGYRIEREFKFESQSWKLVRDQTIEHD